MFNRRNLRIKVMQALYAFYRSENPNLKKCEKELLLSIEKTHDLYIYLFLLITEIANSAGQYAELSKTKHLPTQEDLNLNPKFIKNRFIKQLAENKELKRLIESKRLSWFGDLDIVKNIFLQIKSSDEYAAYLASSDDSYNADREFIITIFKMHIANFSPLRQFLEQKSIFWAVDIDLVNHMVLKTIISDNSDSRSKNTSLLRQYRDTEEDRDFVLPLFRKTILHEKEYEKLIGKKAKNWETERIAMIDILLMKMAMCEILEFPTIPVKVSLNEYIEIAKQYSTPRSNIFINGILDKLVAGFKKGKKIKKTGRGLVN